MTITTGIDAVTAALIAWRDHGDPRSIPTVIAAWARYSGYCAPRCDTVAAWKNEAVEYLRYVAWREGWHSGYQYDPHGSYWYDTVWYADTPCGQISFHLHPHDRLYYTQWSPPRVEEEGERGLAAPFATREYAQPYAGRWDGQRGATLHRLAEYFGVDAPHLSSPDWDRAVEGAGGSVIR